MSAIAYRATVGRIMIRDISNTGFPYDTLSEPRRPYFSIVIRRAMRDLGLTSSDLSERFNTSSSIVRRWMSGASCPPVEVRRAIMKDLSELSRLRE
jgi:ribosome-binding protein aMBF1 (putative translation factor)